MTPTFAIVTLSALLYFIALGMLFPVLPLFVEGPLDGGGLAVGVAAGAFSLSAAILRPFAGRLGDNSGRRILIVGGSLVVGVSIAAYGLVASLVPLVALRLVTGVGEAAVFVGAATATQDLAPPERRGEAASYFSVSIYGGLAIGPALGEAVLDMASFEAVWLVAGGLCVLAAVLGAWAPSTVAEMPAGTQRGFRLLHPAALRPGVVLGLSLIAFAGFSTFVRLYVEDIGLDNSDLAFAVYGGLVLAVRVLGARIPDRFGTISTATAALLAIALGMAVMAGLRSATGLYAGTAIFAVGMSLLFPALISLVVAGVPEAERSSAVATFSIFFDLSQFIGLVILGGVVSLGGEPAAFAAGSISALLGLAVLRALVPHHVGGTAAAPPTPEV